MMDSNQDLELSLDNETLATTHDAMVLTVGGVLFRGDTVLEEIHFAVNLDEQVVLRRGFKASTFRWWMQQSDDARASILTPPEVKINTGRAILRDLGSKVQQIWARPAMFDLPMLRHLFGQDLWDDAPARFLHHGYQKERDLGTLVKEFDPIGVMKPAFVGTNHSALDDAAHHHRWLQSIRRELRARGAYTPKAADWTEMPAGIESPISKRVWTCKIGECTDEQLQKFGGAADSPMRNAVSEAYEQVIGEPPKFIFSGWAGELTESERMVVDHIEKQGN